VSWLTVLDGKLSRTEATGVDLAINGLAGSTDDDHDSSIGEWRSSTARTRS
jgi:hypothetical protein